MDKPNLKPFIQKILENPLNHDWTLQGMGMLRLYLTPELRMHIWHNDFQVDLVTKIHTHPWNMKSYVIAGMIRNQRRVEHKSQGHQFFKHQIKCGQGGGLVGKPKKVLLAAKSMEYYVAGQEYRQRANEIHCTYADNGTVTLLERFPCKDPDHAYVYYPMEFVSGAPRRATQYEVLQICGTALTTWFQ